MKKSLILAVLALLTMSVSAQHSIDLRHETRAEITKCEFSNLRAVFSYGSIESIEVSTEKGTFSEISIAGTYASGEIGTPELPVSHQLLAVPFGAIPSVNVINYNTTDYKLSDYGINTILPHQPSVRKDQKTEDITFAYDAMAYQTRSLSSAPETTIEIQGTMRGIRIGSLVINPTSYDPSSNTLRVFNDIEVEINFEGADRAETERMLLNTYSPYFDIVYKQMFNYRQILDVYTDHPDLMAYPVHMLVITPQNYVSSLQPWIDWKIQKGFDVNVYTTNQTGTTYNAIRSFVQNQYNTGVSQGNTPTFLVLVGDVAQIPATNGSQTQKVTDLYYGSVDNDYFPDIFYSRMSAENTTQLTSIINKILQYEQFTMPDPSYLSNVLLIAGQDDYWNPRVAQPTINYATTYYYNLTHGFNNVYAYLNSYTGCYNNLSTGVGFANYTAHGSETGWSGPSFSNSNVNNLNNVDKYFLAMGNCCLTGNFGYNSPCFGETMIRATNKGAYSYIGSCPVTYWFEDYYFGVGAHNTHGGPTPTLQGSSTGCYDGIWMDETYNTVSSMVFLGNLAVCYAHTGNYQTHSNPTYYWQAYHVLGDGSIMPYRVNPTQNNVSHASTFPAGATTFTVTAQPGSYVGISQNNMLKGAALVPASGTVNVPVSAVSSGQVRIVVTKPQRRPYIQDINVDNGGSPTYTITISANPTEGGAVAFNNKGYQNHRVSNTNAKLGGTLTNAGLGYGTSTNNITRDWYYYDNGVNQDALGTGGGQFWWAIMLPAGTYNGNTLTKVAVFDYMAMTGTASIYQGGNTSPAGYALGQTNVTLTGSGNFVEFPFANPITLDPSQNVWIVFYNASGATYPASVCDNTGDPNGRWISLDGTTWDDVVSYNLNYTFMIRAFIEPDGGDPQGSVSAIFNQGQSCTVIATPNTGYTFTNWTENGNVVSTNANYTFSVDCNRTLVANFVTEPLPQQYTINLCANPTNGGTVDFSSKNDRNKITYDFENGMQGWSTIDADGDGYNWRLGSELMGSGYGHNNSSDLVISQSYDNNAGPLMPDNYLVSPQINLGGSITFYACAQDNAWSSEHFGVAVSTTSNNNANAFNTIQEWNMTSKSGGMPTRFTREGQNRTQGNWYQYTVDLSAFNGEIGYVAIRHFNCSDMFYIDVDDITITESAGNSTSAVFNEGETCAVTATPNSGFVFDSWTENGTVVSSNANYTFTVNSDRNLVANFTTEPMPQYTVTISANPTDAGTVAFNNKGDQDTCLFNTSTKLGGALTNAGHGYGAATNEITRDWYYYDNGVNQDALGTGGGQFWWAIMLPAGTYNGNTLTKVAVFDYMAMTGTASIYQGGNTSPAGYALGQTNVTLTGSGNFVEFPFANPITLDPSQNVWVVFYNASGATYPASVCDNTGDPNGRWISLDGTTWDDVVSYNLNYTFMIRAFIEPDGGDPQGSVSAIFNQGQSCTVTATANPGYTFTNWTDNNNVVSTNATYTFSVNNDCILVANFVPSTFIIVATSGDNGTITPSGNITVSYGANQSFEIFPDMDYEIQDVIVDGHSIGAVSTYTFENVISDHSIYVTFSPFEGVDETLSHTAVYPNPTTGIVTMTNNGFKEVKVYNTMGMLIKSLNTEETDCVEINLSELPDGVYIIQAFSESQSITKQVVKMN